MSKVICDVCGTTYPETSVSCPICGCAKNTTSQTAADSDPQADSAAGYTYVKGGRFSKSNVRKRSKENRDYSRGSSNQKPEQDKTNVGLIVVVMILLLAIVAVLIYIGVRVFTPDTPQPSGTSQSTIPSSTVPSQPTTVPCIGIDLEDEVITLTAEGSVWLLNVKAEPADTTDKISFASSNDLVATVSSSGNVKAIGAGEAVITITCGEITKECKVICNFGTPVDPTVPSTDPTQNIPADFVLKLNREDFTLSNEGEKWTLYTETNGVKASDITWTVDDPTVAIVENGRVTAINYGDTQVHATIGDQTVSCWVRVRFYAATEGEGEEEGEKLKLNKTDVTIKVDETFTLTLTNSEGVKMNVEFTANEEGYVTIDGSRITGAKGTAELADRYVVVSATYEDVTYSCKVRVTEPKTDE